MKFFNIAGPCNKQDHYMVDNLQRLNTEIFPLIDEKQYFIIHASRQSGKTTLLMELTRQINSEGKYYALYCSLENFQTVEKPEVGIPAIINMIQTSLINYKIPNARLFIKDIDLNDCFNSLQTAFNQYCEKIDKPLVIFFDEADCLSNQTLISFLRQLRSGYVNRANVPFVHSLALTGMRNIKDYRNGWPDASHPARPCNREYRSPEQTMGTASPFNISAASLTLRNFTKDEINDLYSQHTAETGNVFEKEAVEYCHQQTQGQPWLVNAVARESIKGNTIITPDIIASSIQKLILRRDTHFDSMMPRLHEERIRRIIEPLITGDMLNHSVYSDDYSYVKDMGLIRDNRGKIEPANPIYTEIMTRTLNTNTQIEMEQSGNEYNIPRYLQNDSIDMNYLLKDFQIFWRENSEIWKERYDYKEAAPQLILQAFLQRVLNGGGQITREMAAASGRVDLCVIYMDKKYPIELKINRGQKSYADGLKQTAAYMDTLGCNIGWLILFDNKKNSWKKRLFSSEEKVLEKTVFVYGM